MDHGWIVTLAADARAAPQLEHRERRRLGHAGAGALDRGRRRRSDLSRAPPPQGYEIVYDLTDEPWGVRRFFVRDPVGTVVNILSHAE